MPKGTPKKKPAAKPEPIAESWEPKPDMGKIQPPTTASCKNCGDSRSMHYEGPRDWCNSTGCDCQAWTE